MDFREAPTNLDRAKQVDAPAAVRKDASSTPGNTITLDIARADIKHAHIQNQAPRCNARCDQLAEQSHGGKD